MNSNSSNLSNDISSTSSPTNDSHDRLESIFTGIATRQSLKTFKASIFLNMFMESRINYYHQCCALVNLDINMYPIDSQCRNHTPTSNGEKRTFDIKQAQGNCSFCTYFVKVYLPSLKLDWCENSKTHTLEDWTTRLTFHPNFSNSDASKFHLAEGGWEIAKLFSWMRMTTIEDADTTMKLQLLEFHPAFQDIRKYQFNLIKTIRDIRNDDGHLVYVTNHMKNHLIVSIQTLLKKIEEHWSSPEYGDIGFLYEYPKIHPQNYYCGFRKKNDQCQRKPCGFSHNFTSLGSISSSQKYDIEQSIENLNNLMDVNHIKELVLTNSIDPDVLFEAHCESLQKRLQTEVDIFGLPQPDLTQFIQLEFSPYTKNTEGDKIGRRDDDKERGRDEKEKIKLCLQDFCDRPHDVIEENPQSSSSSSSNERSEREIKNSIHHNLSFVIGAPGSGKSTFSRCLTMALCKKQNQDIPFLASSKTDSEFFTHLIQTNGRLSWWQLFQQLSDSKLSDIGIASSYKLTLIVDGLDELSDPQKTIQALANFICHETNAKIIKRVIITSRPGCVFQYQNIQNHFNLDQASQYKDNLVVNIAPFTEENCLELVTNLLTIWSKIENKEVDQHMLQKVQNHALRFAETPILINMICHLSLDPNFNIETATILNIYHNICEKLVDRYLKTSGIKDEFNDYHEFLGLILRISAYLMHRIGFNAYQNDSKKNNNDDINVDTLKETIKSLFTNDDWMQIWQSMTKKGNVSSEHANRGQLIDEALGCLYQAGENSYCFLHRTIREYLCADFLVNYTEPLVFPLESHNNSSDVIDSQKQSKEEQRRSSGYTAFFRDEMKFVDEDVQKYRDALITKGALSLEKFQQYLHKGHITVNILEEKFNFKFCHAIDVVEKLTSDRQSHHDTSFTLTNNASIKGSNLKDVYQRLGKTIVGNKQNQLDFHWFDTNFYLSEWWDQVYNFGWHFYRDQNPWCQHLYYRKRIYKCLGSDCLLESGRYERDFVITAVQTDCSPDGELKYASDELKRDREVVLASLWKFSAPLKYVSEELKRDRDFMLTAMSKHNLHDDALRYASKELKRDRELLLAAVSQNGSVLQNASEELKRDREVVLTAVSQRGWALEFTSEELKRDREVVLTAVSNNGGALLCASEELKRDREVVLTAMSNNGWALQYASEELKNDREIVLTAVSKSGGRALQYASFELKCDREVVLAAVSNYGLALQYASFELKCDREVVLTAVSQDGQALEYTLEELKRDREVVLTAVSQDGRALEYTLEELKRDREVVLTAVKSGYSLHLNFASEELKRDREFVLTAVKNACSLEFLQYSTLMRDREFVLAVVSRNGRALEYASEELKRDREVVLTAVSQDGRALEYAWEEWKRDRDFLLTAVSRDGRTLEYASEDLKHDRDFILAAVTNSGWALEYASEELRRDREVVLIAVSQRGWALQYASEELKRDREVVLTAVSNNGWALQYASKELKRDREVVLAAVSNNGWALQYASKELKRDREVVLAAVSQSVSAFKYASFGLKCDQELLLAADIKYGTDKHHILLRDHFRKHLAECMGE